MARRRGWIPLVPAILVCLVVPCARVHADDVEYRDFAIFINGKESGQSRVTITVQNDGTTVVAASVQVKLEKLILKYDLKIDGMEWWKDGKLIGLKSNTAENGKRIEVIGAVEGNQFKVRVNGQDRAVRPDVWTSSFWKLADAKYHNKQIPVLESDSGKEYTGQLQYIGTDQLPIGGQPQNCYHFRVSGGPYPVDLWFDRFHRLVRQEFTDSGHKTIVQLTSVRR